MKNRRAIMFFIAAACFAATAILKYSHGNSIDACLWLSITVAELFLGVRELHGKTK